jgi:hypothetical protein
MSHAISARHHHHRRVENMRLPRTALAAAFLAALQRWAVRHHGDDIVIAIPAGTVTAGELTRVVLALLAIQKAAVR